MAYIPDGWLACSDEAARRSLFTTSSGGGLRHQRFPLHFCRNLQARRRDVRVTCDRVVGHKDSIQGLSRSARRGPYVAPQLTSASPSDSRAVKDGLRKFVEWSARTAPGPRSRCSKWMRVGSARSRELQRSLSNCGRFGRPTEISRRGKRGSPHGQGVGRATKKVRTGT